MKEIDERYFLALAHKLTRLIYEDFRKKRETMYFPKDETFVQHIKTGNIYESIKKAAEAHNMCRSNVEKHLKGDMKTQKFQRVDKFGCITSKNKTHLCIVLDVIHSILDRQKYICPLTYIDLRPKIEECLPFLKKDAAGAWYFGPRGHGLPVLSTNRINNNIGHTIDNMFITTVHWNSYLNDGDLKYILKHDTEIQQLRELNIHNWHPELDEIHPIFQTSKPSQLSQESDQTHKLLIIS